MKVSATTQPGSATDADTVALGLFDGGEPSADAPAEVGELLDSGEACGALKSLALAHADGKRWLVVGLGKREDFTPERARVAAAVARDRARELSTATLCWELPPDGGPEVAAALVEGTLLADYRFERYKSAAPAEADASPRASRACSSPHPRSSRRRSPRPRSSPSGQRRPRSAEPARQRSDADGARRVREVPGR